MPYRATIAYNADAGQFEGVDGVSGDAPVYDNAAANLTIAVKELKDKVELTSATGYVDGEKATDSEQVKNALKEANAYLDVTVTCENMATYCTELAKKHDVSKKKTGQFKTTGGSIINVPVASSGQTVDGNKLYEAIAEAINNKKSATVEAVYSEAKEYVT